MFKKTAIMIIAAIALAIFSTVGAAQSEDATKKTIINKARFVAIYTLDAAWKGKSLAEAPLDKHAQYVGRLAKERKLLVGGPFKDFTGAILIIEAESEREAREIIGNDPLVKDKIVKAEIHPWHVAIKGCVD